MINRLLKREIVIEEIEQKELLKALKKLKIKIMMILKE
jgi:signal recognition particle subunit SEC65